MPNRKIMLITPGPLYSIAEDKLTALSAEFSGYFVSASDSEAIRSVKRLGSFDVRFSRSDHRRRVLSAARQLWLCLGLVVRSRFSREPVSLVATYDPLTTGLIGWLCAIIVGARFASEVNGVYTAEAEYLDSSNRSLANLKKAFYRLLMSFVLRRAVGIKLQFPGQIDSLRIDLRGKTVRCFHNYIDLDLFLDLQRDDERKLVLFIGFPFYRKGVDILVRAFKLVAEAHPDWRLRILGWYPDPELLLREVDSHAQIEIHAPVQHSEVPRHMAECSIFVMPSRSEAKSRSLIEAMAAGKARIGSDVDGTPTIINDNVDGLLFRNGDHLDLAHKLALFMDNPDLRKRLGLASELRARREFAPEVHCRDLMSFYREVLDA